MWESPKRVRTRCDMLHLAMNIISTICLVAISVSLMSAGVYTVHKVQELQRTYHPERLGQVFDKASSALDTLHATTKMLQSTRDDESVSTLPQLFTDARATMEQTHASLLLGQALLQVPELKTMLRNIPDVITSFKDSLPQEKQFYDTIGRVLSDTSWVTHFSDSLVELSSSVDTLDVQRLLDESQAWRNMSFSTMAKLRRIVHDL